MNNSQDVAIFNTGDPSKVLVAQQAEPDLHRFIIGSCMINKPNAIRVLDFDDERGKISCVASYAHKHEVIDISPSPFDALIVSSVFRNAEGSRGATVWKLTDSKVHENRDSCKVIRQNDLKNIESEINDLWDTSARMESEGSPRSLSDVFYLEELFSFPHGSSMISAQWSPAEEKNILLACHDKLELWDAVELRQVSRVASGHGFANVKWDCIHPHRIITSERSDILIFDTRSGRSEDSVKMEKVHVNRVTDLDVNPNKPNHIVTGGDDGLVKFWDLRSPSKPLRLLSGHSHWVTQVKYNPYHDQLVLSGGSDGILNLWNILSVSSTPQEEETRNRGSAEDRRIQRFDEHEDSIYSSAWSASDAWVFASMSYSGRVMVNRVPQGEKYNILL